MFLLLNALSRAYRHQERAGVDRSAYNYVHGVQSYKEAPPTIFLSCFFFSVSLAIIVSLGMHVPFNCDHILIPATDSCPADWTREYYGYLMTAHSNSRHYRTMFECVDKSQESLPYSVGDTHGAVFYHVEASCGFGHLPCPPYNAGDELNCVVCTK